MARITFSTMYNTTMRHLQLNAAKMDKLAEQAISEQKINRPSDNPIGFTNVLRYGNVLNSLGQQRVNMDDGGIYMSVLEATHDKMNKLFQNSKDLAIQGANDPVNHSQRLIINMDVRQNLELLVSLAQTKHKEGFIFSGKWTNQPPYEIKNGEAVYYEHKEQTATPPFSDDPPFDYGDAITIRLLDGNYNDPNIPVDSDPDYINHPVVQRIIPGSVSGLEGLKEKPSFSEDGVPDYDYEIDYVNGTITLLSGDAKRAFYDETTGDPRTDPPNMSFEYIYRNSIDMSGEIYREIDTGITMKINTNPDDLFGKAALTDTDSFKEIIALMQGLWYNDQAQIANGIDTVEAARERNLKEQAVEGSRLSRLDIVFDRNLGLEETNTKAYSDVMDVELEEVINQFNMAKMVYDLSLYTSANVLNRSLMDYL